MRLIVDLGGHIEHVEDIGIIRQGQINQILDSTIADQRPDSPSRRGSDTYSSSVASKLASCVCHTPGKFADEVIRKANFSGIDVSKVNNVYGTGITWGFVDRLRAVVKSKLALKGIM